MTLFAVTAGAAEPLGVTPDGTGVNVAVRSVDATAIYFCLFDEADSEIARIALPARTGHIYHGHVATVPQGARYGLRADGAYDPARGLRFRQAKLLLDPYGLQIDRPFRLHPILAGEDERDSAACMPKAIVMERPPAFSRLEPPIRWDEMVIYEMHVRGFSQLHPAVPPALQGRFAALAEPVLLDHLKRLGVTSIEIMPAMAWIDERHLPALGLNDYWGYNPVGFCAPDPRLAPQGWAEIGHAIAALHQAGMEAILDVVFNHTGESDELGPVLSLRGLDNARYYRLRPDNRALYVNDAGCGNILALDDPGALRLVMDSLRLWARAGFDGFRFDLATILGRRAVGFDPLAPLLLAIGQDPVLRHLKLIAEPWDLGPGGYQLGAFDPAWGEWNDQFRDTMRRFWRGDDGMIGAVATRFAGSADLFAAKTRPSRGINFIVAHDGFSLADLVSYERKHNEANGEFNKDGTDANFSWSHGCEGPSDNPAIIAARLLDQRNMLASLLLARGTPMLAMGAERGHSQNGNNNAYAQDNEISWLDWSRPDEELGAFIHDLITVRRSRRALSCDRFLDQPGDVLWLNPDGTMMRIQDWQDSARHSLIILLSTGEEPEPDRVMVILHAGAAAIDVKLPDGAWRILIDTTALTEPALHVQRQMLRVAGRSVIVLGASI